MYKLYQEMIKFYWVDYLFLIIVGAILINLNIDFFLIFVFIVLVLKIDAGINQLRKLSRITNLITEARLVAISRKIKVNTDEIAEIIEAQKDNLSEKEAKQLEKDISDVVGRTFKF